MALAVFKMKINRQTRGLTVGELLLVLFVVAVAVAVGAGALFLLKPSGLNKAPLPAPNNVQPKLPPPAP